MEYSHTASSAINGGSHSLATSSPAENPSEMDNLLAAAGYQVRISDLHHVAENLETLETAMANSSFDLPDGLIHYNPSDLASWLESLLPESGYPTHLPVPGYPQHPKPPPLTLVSADVEEGSGIRVVHLLMSCAESVQRGELSLALTLLDEMNLLLKLMNLASGIGKVAGYFMEALSRRVYGATPAYECGLFYHHFYEACPYLKFAHFTANQAILEAFDGHGRVHVVDFDVIHGLQWPPLIQALALRPGGPPFLTITSIGPDRYGIGLKLGQLARSVKVPFVFNVVEPWKVQVDRDEVVAVNSIMQLHRLVGPGTGQPGPITSFLEWIKSLRPKIVTIVEQEANHNRTGFLDRFTEALHYYSTMFDSLEACRIQPEKALAEMYIQNEIRNILCCEGSERVERHESLTSWKARLHRAGFEASNLGSNAFKQASMLLTLFSAEGYCVEECDGCLSLGWHSRPLIAASAWKVGPSVGPN